jgi:hypothetical protein
MLAARAVETGELKLSAERRELLALAGAAEAGSGYFSLAADADVTPYDVALSDLEIRPVDRPTVRVAVGEAGKRLVITGDSSSLGVFAQNLRGLAETPITGDHLHIEYYPEHFYLDSESLPLVVECAE